VDHLPQPRQNALPQPFLETDRGEEKESSLDLFHYWRVIVKRKWGILGLAILAGIISAIYSYSKTPLYSAKATLLVEPRISAMYTPVSDPGASASLQFLRATQYFETQRAVLLSRNFIAKIVESKELWKHPEFDPDIPKKYAPALSLDWQSWIPSEWLSWLSDQPKASPALTESAKKNYAINAVRAGLSVNLVNNTQLIDVGFKSPNPELAAAVANAVAEVYIEQDLETRLETFKAASEWLTDRTVGLREKLKESELKLQEYREQEQLISIGGGANTFDLEMQNLFNRLLAAQSRRSELATLMLEVEALKKRPPLEVAEHPTVLKNESVLSAYKASQEAVRKVNELSLRYGPKHPQMKSAQDQLAATRSRLVTEVRVALDNVSTDFEIAQQTERRLEEEFGQYKDRSQDLNRKVFEFHALEKDVEANRELYDLFVTRFKETNIASDLDTPSARVIDAALVPSSPFWPNPQKDIAFAIAGALALGIMLAFLLEFLDNTVKGAEEVEERLKLPHLVTLPLLKAKEAQTAERFFLEKPNSTFGEGIRTLRTSVLLSGLDNPHRVVLVTSTVPSEGKTTVSINLALSLAHLERVLLIDGDMRRASIGTHFGVPKDAPGLSNLVAGSANESECIFQIEGTKLHVLPSGLIPPNPQELLSSARFTNLLVSLSARYDRIVIDTAPTLAVSDALLISPLASAMIYVIKADSTPVQVIQNALKKLRQVDARLIGAVLNQLNADKAKQYGYHYGRYYNKYYSQYYGKN